MRGLHLDHATLRNLPLTRPAPLHLLRRIEAEVRMARALIGQLSHAEHFRPQRCADSVQQVRNRSVARPLAGRAARCTHSPEVGEVRLDRRSQLRVRSAHHPCCRKARCRVQVPSRHRPQPRQAPSPTAIVSVWTMRQDHGLSGPYPRIRLEHWPVRYCRRVGEAIAWPGLDSVDTHSSAASHNPGCLVPLVPDCDDAPRSIIAYGSITLSPRRRLRRDSGPSPSRTAR